MSPQPSEIEVVWATPAEIGATILIGFVLIALAFAAGAWAMRGPVEPEQPAEPVEPVNEVAATKSRAPLPRSRHTGTVHADAPTVEIRLPKEVRR